MPEAGLAILIAVIIAAIIFDYINGFNDSANAIATCISTRALSIRKAVVMAAALNLIGALVSTKVATTIGTNIVAAGSITQVTIFAGMSAAIAWGMITWYFAIPSSATHALIGGICGAVVSNAGFGALNWLGLKKIILALLLSPIIGIVVGFAIMAALLWSCRRCAPEKLNQNFCRLQIVAAAFTAFSHGMADAQKSMGIIALALVSYGALTKFYVPWPVMAVCALAMALGTAMGGWRIIKTVGRDFVKLQPIHGFCVQTSAAAVIVGAAAFGLPTSTSHIITSSIVGVGLSKRLSAINWKIAKNIGLAWLFTIPASAGLAFFLHVVFDAVVKKFS